MSGLDRAREWLGRCLHRSRDSGLIDPESVHRNFPGGPVLIVGDSHTWMGGAGRQFPHWDTDCRGGRDTSEGVGVVVENLAVRHRVVVFDMATNDSTTSVEGHFADLLRLRDEIGERQLVLVSNWRLDVSLAHVLENQRRLARDDPARTSMADWGDFAAHHREVFAHDHIHFTDDAMKIRNGMVWSAVRAAELRDASTAL